MLALGKELVIRGVQHRIETTDAEGYSARLGASQRESLRWSGVPVCLHRFQRPRRLKTSLGLARHVWALAKEVDVIHVHGLYLFSFVAAVLSARLRRVPYLVQPHGGLEPYHQNKSQKRKVLWDKLIGRWGLKGAYALVCASESEAASIARAGYENTVVIPHGVVRDLAQASVNVQRRIDTWGDGAVVLFLGRLAKKKHPDVLIRAWSLRERRGARLVFVGPDDDWTASELMELAGSLGCGDSVECIGELVGGDKWAVLVRATLFGLPSESENFGIAVPEALSAGTPCLLTDSVASSADVLAAGAGWVLSALDADAWDEALTQALSNSDILDGMSRAALQHSSRRYAWKDVTDAYIALYEAAHT